MKIKILLFLFVIQTLACNPVKKEYLIGIPESPAIIGLASPFQLGGDRSYFLQSEYFIPSMADSLIAPEGISILLKGDTVFLEGNIIDAISGMKAYKDGFSYFIPLLKSKKVNFHYTFKAAENEYQKVTIRGSFNAWNGESTPLKFNNGIWEVDLSLSPGEYEYLLVVDGKDLIDPNNGVKKDNGIGGFNSIINIKQEDPNKIPSLLTSNFSEDQISLVNSIPGAKIIGLWENFQIENSKIEVKGDIITVEIPEEAKQMNRSVLRIWAYTDEGLSNDIYIPLSKGKPIVAADQLQRMDKHAMMMYFLLIDRFSDGDSTNDFPVDDPSILAKANYYGGDLQGVIDNLNSGYFEDLGINTIWLSPITLNPEGAYGLYPTPYTKFSAYHGYWPIRSTVVDYRYGTMDLLKELIKLAHEKEMNVLIDYVANHVHQEHPIYIEHPDWVTDLYLPDGSLNTERWDDHRLTTWFDTFLPTLDLSRMEVVDPMTDSALFWLKEAGLDGFRHDATKHIPEIFWETLTHKIKTEIIIPEQRDIFQIGETYGSKGLINSYIGTGKLDAQFDFNVYDDAVVTFARKDLPFDRLEKGLKESFSIYGYHNLMGYISGNQDRSRFISFASGDIRFDENQKLAGWTRDITITDSSAFDRLDLLLAFINTIPGIPVIYYGDEIGSPGAGDPDNRRMMKFEGLNQRELNLRNHVSELFHFRKNNPSLIYGDTRFLYKSDDQWAFVRSWFGENALVIFNKSDKESSLKIDLPGEIKGNIEASINNNQSIKKEKQQITIDLAPLSFEIIIIKS